MTAPITMDSDELHGAAQLYESAHNSAKGAIETLASALDSNWGCAGTDSAGKTWSDSYDPAAFDAVAAGATIANAFGKLHDLLAFTAVNHSNTEKANTHPPAAPDPPPAQLPAFTAPRFKGAYGGDSDAPFGWGLISSWLQGHTWPNGDPDKLRSLATAWRNAANQLRDASSQVDEAWTTLGDLQSEEIPQALAQMNTASVSTEHFAEQFEKLGSACDDWAEQIEDAHQKILAILAGALGTGLIAGVVVGIFTAGTGTAAVEGGVGSAAGAAIVGVLVAFDAAAALEAGVVVAAGVAIGGATTQLQPLLEANPTSFSMESAGGGATPSQGSGPWRKHFDQLERGDQNHVREVSGEAEMRRLFDEWTNGGKRLPARGDKIPDVYELDDGTVIQWRTGSKSGGPTIDIYHEGKPLKVHLK